MASVMYTPPGSHNCSTRCANVDLGRWLKGNYRFPSAEAPMFEDAGPDSEES